jgi:hypothetical protein
MTMNINIPKRQWLASTATDSSEIPIRNDIFFSSVDTIHHEPRCTHPATNPQIFPLEGAKLPLHDLRLRKMQNYAERNPFSS